MKGLKVFKVLLINRFVFFFLRMLIAIIALLRKAREASVVCSVVQCRCRIEPGAALQLMYSSYAGFVGSVCVFASRIRIRIR
jgi:hypothetical protein